MNKYEKLPCIEEKPPEPHSFKKDGSELLLGQIRALALAFTLIAGIAGLLGLLSYLFTQG